MEARACLHNFDYSSLALPAVFRLVPFPMGHSFRPTPLVTLSFPLPSNIRRRGEVVSPSLTGSGGCDISHPSYQTVSRKICTMRIGFFFLARSCYINVKMLFLILRIFWHPSWLFFDTFVKLFLILNDLYKIWSY